jgi:hypothetical protein
LEFSCCCCCLLFWRMEEKDRFKLWPVLLPVLLLLVDELFVDPVTIENNPIEALLLVVVLLVLLLAGVEWELSFLVSS